jgi:hypothetical protein
MHLYAAGVPLIAIIGLLGHASMKTNSDFYAFVTWDMVKNAIEKANEGHLGNEKLWQSNDTLILLFTLDQLHYILLSKFNY